jgi:SAM-dependent methyltransferase
MEDRKIVAALALAIGLVSGWAAHAQHVAPSLHASPIASPSALPSSSTMEQVFEDVYLRAKWGTNGGDAGTSGSGSTLRATLLYRTFLEQFMREANVKSVVDAGCGDWEFSQAIDFRGIDYKGFDIVPAIIERDTKNHEKPNVHFFVGDVVTSDLPPADLLIVKHVLQHLPNRSVQAFLAKQLSKYKHVLLINGVNAVSLSSSNPDIAAGAFRNLDVTKPPFNVEGAKILTYWDDFNTQQVVYIAQR